MGKTFIVTTKPIIGYIDYTNVATADLPDPEVPEDYTGIIVDGYGLAHANTDYYIDGKNIYEELNFDRIQEGDHRQLWLKKLWEKYRGTECEDELKAYILGSKANV